MKNDHGNKNDHDLISFTFPWKEIITLVAEVRSIKVLSLHFHFDNAVN